MRWTLRRTEIAYVIAFLILSGGCGKKTEPGKPEAAAAGGAPAAEAPAAATPVPPPRDVQVTESFELDGATVEAVHTKLDEGRVQDLFDGNVVTLGRTENAQTFVLDMKFSKPRRLKGVAVTTATMDVGLKVSLNGATSGAGVYSKELRNGGPDPTLALDFGATQEVRQIKVEVTNLQGGDGHVHVRELKLEEPKGK